MPQLVKLQNELKDAGFVIIGFESQASSRADVAAFGVQKKINFTLTGSGSVPGHEVSGLPHRFLFDASGNLVADGHDVPTKRVQDLVASEPHFLAAGRKYTKHKAEADQLKKTKAFGPILKKLEKSVEGKDAAAAEEAKFLSERLKSHGQKLLASAKALESEDAFQAQGAYTEIAANWKGTEPGDRASARLKELKDDKSFQEELKASTLLQQILAECNKLISQNNKIDHEYALNKKVVAGIRATTAQLRKKYPDSAAAKGLATKLEPFGFKGI